MLADPLSSFRPQRSGVEKSPSPNGTGSITANDLRAQSIMGAVSICPIATRSPARDDDVGERQWIHLRCEGSKGSKGSEGSKGGGGGFAADFKKSRSAPSVISTKTGQPPIGKPLIVQARGQLRLTWRLYAESPQSGEISFLPWYMKHGGRKSMGSESP